MDYPCLVHQHGSNGWVEKVIDHTCFHSTLPLGDTVCISKSNCSLWKFLNPVSISLMLGPVTNQALEDGKENIDFPNFNLIRGKKKAGKCTQTKGLQRSPKPRCFNIITVCDSDHGLSWFSSRCFTWTTRFFCIYILNSSMCWSLHRWHFDLTLYLYNKKHDRWLRTTWEKAQPDGLMLHKQG